MSAENKAKAKKTKKPSKAFRFIIRNDEDLKEVNSFKLTLAKIYLLLGSIFFLLCCIIVSLISFTPIKRLIPGYGDINNNIAFVKLNNELSDIEKQLEEQITYTESLKKIIFNDNRESLSNHNHGTTTTTTTTMLPVNENIKSIPYLFPPVKGKSSMGYLLKKNHFGIDLVCTKNAEVKSIASGVILNTVWDPNTGNTISIQHQNNLVSIYKHNATLLKKPGEQVLSGEVIAIVGNSGEQSNGPHLHFELWSNGQPVNPELYIDFN